MHFFFCFGRFCCQQLTRKWYFYSTSALLFTFTLFQKPQIKTTAGRLRVSFVYFPHKDTTKRSLSDWSRRLGNKTDLKPPRRGCFSCFSTSAVDSKLKPRRLRWSLSRIWDWLSENICEDLLSEALQIFISVTNVKKPLSLLTIYLRVSVQNVEVYLKNSYNWLMNLRTGFVLQSRLLSTLQMSQKVGKSRREDELKSGNWRLKPRRRRCDGFSRFFVHGASEASVEPLNEGRWRGMKTQTRIKVQILQQKKINITIIIAIIISSSDESSASSQLLLLLLSSGYGRASKFHFF